MMYRIINVMYKNFGNDLIYFSKNTRKGRYAHNFAHNIEILYKHYFKLHALDVVSRSTCNAES